MLQIDFQKEVITATPIVGTAAADVASRYFWGLSLHEWFYVAAIGYTVVQTLAVVYKTLYRNKEKT